MSSIVHSWVMHKNGAWKWFCQVNVDAEEGYAPSRDEALDAIDMARERLTPPNLAPTTPYMETAA